MTLYENGAHTTRHQPSSLVPQGGASKVAAARMGREPGASLQARRTFRRASWRAAPSTSCDEGAGGSTGRGLERHGARACGRSSSAPPRTDGRTGSSTESGRGALPAGSRARSGRSSARRAGRVQLQRSAYARRGEAWVVTHLRRAAQRLQAPWAVCASRRGSGLAAPASQQLLRVRMVALAGGALGSPTAPRDAIQSSLRLAEGVHTHRAPGGRARRLGAAANAKETPRPERRGALVDRSMSAVPFFHL